MTKKERINTVSISIPSRLTLSVINLLQNEYFLILQNLVWSAIFTPTNETTLLHDYFCFILFLI